MFDQSILELEEIEGDDRWKYEVLKAKYLTYRDAKAFEEAEQMMKDKAHLRELSEKYGFKEVSILKTNRQRTFSRIRHT